MKLSECGFDEEEVKRIKYLCEFFNAQKLTIKDKGGSQCQTTTSQEQKRN